MKLCLTSILSLKPFARSTSALAFVFLAFLVAPSTYASPDNLEGLIYYEHGAYAGGFVTFEESATVFARDGSFSQIYSRFNMGTRNAIHATLREPENGKYSYRKLDERTAELSFSGGFAHSGVLQFDSATSDTGTFFEPSRDPNSLSGVVRRTFRLVSASSRAVMSNCSNRSWIGAEGTAFTGFVITGEAWRMVLIRAVGPGLEQFGIKDYLSDPVLTVAGADNDNWSDQNATSVRRTSAAIGAFPLPEGSKDAAMLLNLPPRQWVAQVSSRARDGTGQVLIEIYILP